MVQEHESGQMATNTWENTKIISDTAMENSLFQTVPFSKVDFKKTSLFSDLGVHNRISAEVVELRSIAHICGVAPFLNISHIEATA